MDALDLFNLTDQVIGSFFRLDSPQRHTSVFGADVDRLRVADEAGKVGPNAALENFIVDDLVREASPRFDDDAPRPIAKVTRPRAQSGTDLLELVCAMSDLVTQECAAAAAPAGIEKEHRCGAKENSEKETFVSVHINLPILSNTLRSGVSSVWCKQKQD